MGIRANNIIRVSASLDKDFFKYWLIFLRPYHKLTEREIDIVACFLKHRHALSAKVTDADLLDKIIMSEDIKKEVQKECDIPLQYFQVMLSKFRKKGIIINNKINPKFIPKLRRDETSFQLLFLFDLESKDSNAGNL